MATSNVSGNFTGTGWTINVGACNLDPSLSIIDFLPFISGTPVSPSLFQKTSQSVLTYIGSALGSNTPVVIQRKTPTSVLKVAAFGARIASSDWNAEMDRRQRLSEEYALNGVGPSSLVTVALPQDAAFGVAWSGDTIFPPTRNSVYNWGVTLAPLASPTFTGTPKVPTQSTADSSTNAASTAYVQNNLVNYAGLASPVFTGNPTCNTQVVTDKSTKIANTDYVQRALGQYARVNGGRLTLVSGKPVMDSYPGNASTIYFTPYLHNEVALYDGSTQWQVIQFAEVSLALSGLTTGKNYDVFIYNNAGTVTIETSVWTDDITRATALVRQDGVLVKSGATTRRYVGCFRAISATQTRVTLAAGVGSCLLQNCDNKVPISIYVQDTTVFWTYNSQTWRAANANSNYRLDVISGEGTTTANVVYYQSGGPTGTDNAIIGIGRDSTSAVVSVTTCGFFPTSGGQATAIHQGLTPLGYHYYQALERIQGAGNVNFYGTALSGEQSSGLHLQWWY
jgi:hypothetical protein